MIFFSKMANQKENKIIYSLRAEHDLEKHKHGFHI